MGRPRSEIRHHLTYMSPIFNSTLRANHASHGGGVYNRGMLGLVDNTVTWNHASVQGGGIANRGQMNLIRTKVVANTPENLTPLA